MDSGEFATAALESWRAARLCPNRRRLTRLAITSVLLAQLGFLSCSGESGPISAAPRVRSASNDTAEAADVDDDEPAGEEAREAEQDVRLRQRAVASLDTYRAPTCAAAVARIEEFLRAHASRWHERAGGGLPSDLTAVLVQAELWGSQSAAVCADDPARPRLDALRALMTSIWRFPKELTRAELERQLQLLGDGSAPAPVTQG